MPVPTDIVIPNELLVGIKPKGFVTIIIGPQEKDSNARVVTLEPQFGATVIGKTIDGRYPDYRRVIPREVSGESGRLSGGYRVPHAGGLHQWLLRVAESSAIGASAVRCSMGRADSSTAPALARELRGRILEDLREEGERINHKRVVRLMRSAGLVGISRRKGFKTTVRDHDARPAPDLVKRSFTADRPDQLWVADITYVPTLAGFLFLAVVMDVFSRRIVGWAMAAHLRTELILDALNMAIYQRRPRDVIHHSDQGTQYTSIAFGARCREAGVRPSMGSVGDCFDNAMCESFFATLECELVDRRRFESQAEAKMAIFEFIEGWYNLHRRHSSIGYLSPVNYERRICPTRTQPLQCQA